MNPMGRSMDNSGAWIGAWCAAVLGTSQAWAGVLLLAHYNKTLDADVPQGTLGQAAVHRAKRTTDAKGFPFADSMPHAEAADVAYSDPSCTDAAIRYDAQNIDTRQGTIEFWVKSRWAWDAEPEPNKPVQHMFLSVPMAGPKKPGLYVYFAADRGHRLIPHLVFNIYDGHRDHVTNVRLDRRRQIPFDPTPNRWHHIVVTWTPRTTRLFLDGQEVGRREWEQPIDLTPPAGPIVVGNLWRRPDRPAEALIDELRIVDYALYPHAKSIPVPTKELGAEIRGAAYAAGGPTTAFRPEVRRMYCYRVDTPPKIDGRLDDAVWKRLPAAGGFTTNDSRHAIVPEQTDVQVCHDRQNLYLAVTCHEDDLTRLRTNAKGPGKTMRVFGDDTIEIFLSRNAADGLPYIQMGVNAANTRGDHLCKQPARGEPIDTRWRSAVGKRPRAWCVELVFPFADLPGPGGAPSVGDVWRWNVCRDRRVGGLQYSSMNFVVCGFHSPSEFGELVFAAAPAMARTREEARHNADYLKHVRAEVRRLADQVRRELTLSRTISPAVARAADLTPLVKEVQGASGKLSAFVGRDGHHTVTAWSGVLLDCKRIGQRLNTFGYRVSGLGPTGPIRPPADLKPGACRKDAAGIWFMASDQFVVAFSPRTGAIAGLWEQPTGRRILTSGYDQYLVETRTDELRSDERMDRAEPPTVGTQPAGLTFRCANPDLPKITLTKTYRFESVGPEQRILARRLGISGKPKDLTLLYVTSNTLFDAAFRKGAWYNRLRVIGTAGDPRGVIPADEVTAPITQRAWFNSSEGRAQFALLRPTEGVGLAQYLYKVNGQWTFPQALAQSYWTAFGWQMGSAGTFVKQKPYTAETRYHLFRGDRLTFHHEYWNLPEYVALRRQWTPHPDMRRIRSCGAGFMLMNINHWKNAGPRDYVQAIAGTWDALCRPNEVCVSLTGPQDNRWSHYPASDKDELLQYDSSNTKVQRRNKAPDVRRAFKALNTRFPKQRMGLYKFIIEISCHSPVFRKHPEWLLRDRRAQPVSGYFGPGYWLANWCPAFVDYLADALLKQVDYLDEDVLYLDFSAGIVLPDWGRGEVVGFDVYFDFLKRLQKGLAQRGKFLWLNAFTGQPFYDVGYWEGACSIRMAWRDSADELLMRKIYTRPGAPTVPIYWHGGDMFVRKGSYNEQRYIDLVLGLGFPVTGCYLDPYQDHFPAKKGGCDWASVVKYQAAVGATTLEYYNSDWYDIGLQPAWWRDLDTPIEAYTLKQGDAYLVNVISHHKDTRDVTLSADVKRMGFDPKRPVFYWQFQSRDPAKFPKKVPLAKNWNEMFESRTCQVLRVTGDRLTFTMPKLPPDRVRVSCLTQVPAFICSAGGKATQTLLPATLDCRVQGTLDPDRRQARLTYKVSQPAEILVWRGRGPKPPTVRVGAGVSGPAPVTMGGQPFLRLKVAKGKGTIRLTSRTRGTD